MHLSGFDVSKLTFMGNSKLSTVLKGRSAIDVLVSLSERAQAADMTVA